MQLLDQLQRKAAKLNFIERGAINTIVNMIPKQEIYLHEHKFNLLIECIIKKDHAQIDNFCEAYDIPDDNDLRRVFHRLAIACADESELTIRKEKELEIENRNKDTSTRELVASTFEEKVGSMLDAAMRSDSAYDGVDSDIPLIMTETQYNAHIAQREKDQN